MPSEITVFAETNFRNQRRKFGIKVDDRRRHMYVVGKTGMGKSTLLENMVVTDIRAGHGLAVVDPHGDLAEKILSFIPNERINDVIYFNPSDTAYPIAFNILETIGPEYKHLVAYGLVGVFKKIWADSWGPRMEYIMTNTILALLDYPGSTLLGVMRMLVDKAYRKKVVSKVTDPVIKTFWADEFANYSEKFRTEAIAPIQNKIGQFLASSIIRNIVGQSKSTIEMRTIMDERKILIMNLAKGRIGEENSALLGAMMITKLQIAAMSRVDIVEEERRDFFLYVDEFQNFATDSFAGILSEARKYRLCLIMAHQYFEQLNDLVKAAVFGNVGTLIVFRVGATDAAELELEFAPQFMPTDIVNLKKYTFCMRLMVDGVATEPFSAIGLPPVTGTTDNTDKVIRVSRERYARPQNLVEDRIIRWSGVEVARPQGQTSPTLNADEFSDNDFGDDDVVAEASAEVSPKTTQANNTKLIQAEAEVKLEQSMGVDLSKLIPGEQASAAVQAQTPQVALAKEDAATGQTPPSVAPPVEQFVTESPPSSRPKINFALAVEPVTSQSPAPVAPTPAVKSVPLPTPPPRSINVPPPAVPTVNKPASSVSGPPSSSAVNNTVPKPNAVKPIVPSRPMSQSVNPTPAVTTQTGGGLSLKTLQTGTAPKVSFKEMNRVTPPTPAITPSPTSTSPKPVQSQNPSAPIVPAVRLEPMPTIIPSQTSRPMSSAPGSVGGSSQMSGSNQSLSNMSGAKKRKRKRKRKSGQASDGSVRMTDGGVAQPAVTQNPTSGQMRPASPPALQRPVSAPPQPAPVVRSVSPQTPPSPPTDSTKVSLKDLV